MPRPASNRAWCQRWDELSSLLLDELGKQDCDVTRVTELIRQRRRLTTHCPAGGPEDPVVPEQEQMEWLKRSLEREGRLAELALEVRERLGRSLTSLEAGRAVRSRFESDDAKPRVFSTRV